MTSVLSVAWARRCLSPAPRSTPVSPGVEASTVKTPVREGLGRVLRDKRFVTYVLTLTGYYMLAVR